MSVNPAAWPFAAKIALTGAGALALSACGTAAHPQVTVRVTAKPPSTRAPKGPIAVKPAPSPSVLSMQQAAAAYVRIIDPANRAQSALTNDATDNLPFTQYQADSRVYISDIQRVMGQLHAIRWPTKVQPYITALLLTDTPADIQCTQLEMNAGSYAAAQAASGSQVCVRAQDGSIPNDIRSILGLPPSS